MLLANSVKVKGNFQRWRSFVNSSNLLHVLRLRSMIVWEAGCQYNGSFASIRLSIQFFPHFMGIGIDWKFLARRDCTMGVQQYQRKKIWCLWSDLNYKTCKMHHCQLHVPGTLSFLNICGHQFWIWEKSTIFRIKFKFVNINHVNGPTHQY